MAKTVGPAFEHLVGQAWPAAARGGRAARASVAAAALTFVLCAVGVLGAAGAASAAGGGRQAEIDAALEQLKSDDESVRSEAEASLEALWSKSGSASMDLLLKRARDAMEAENADAALEHLTDLVNLAPDFAEAWNARATVQFGQEKLGEALADLAEALALEANHFGALAGVGVVLEALGDEAGAMAAYRRALEIHPHLEPAQAAVDRLGPMVDGRDI